MDLTLRFRRSLARRLLAIAGAATLAPSLVSAAGCGGNVVVDGGGDGGQGGTASVGPGPGPGPGPGSTSSGSTACDDHADCTGDVCLFGSGTCAAPCTTFEPCPTGLFCDGCATSSCPMCDDCVAACVSADPGQCDDHDDCPPEQLCVYATQTCAPQCTADGLCADPSLVCDFCATSSCPGCENCLGACVAL